MNRHIRRLEKYGIFCDDYRSEVSNLVGELAGKKGYKVLLGNKNIKVWIVGNSLYGYGFGHPKTFNELIYIYKAKEVSDD
jgi:hypothetical protein